MKTALKYLEKQSNISIFFIATVFAVLIAIADHYTGPEIASSIFYFPPIIIASLYATRRTGISTAFICAFLWLATDITSGHFYSYKVIQYWNALVRLMIFLFVAFVMHSLRLKILLTEELARTDPLTGLLNTRGFYERADEEIERSRRYNRPFTLAYIDVDNFKMVNDTLGHIAGDELLRTVAHKINSNSRKTDIVARPGGDEFVILFSETDYQPSEEAIQKIRRGLMDSVAQSGLPVSFSIGIVTFETPPKEVNLMIKLADNLMYTVKNRGKNNILHKQWNGEYDRE